MKKGFIKAAVGALALTTLMGFACADNFSQGNKYEGTWEVKETVDSETGEPTGDYDTTICQLANTAAFEWGNYDASENDFIILTLTPHDDVDTTSISFGLNAFDSNWGGWKGIWGEDKQYVLMGKVSDLLDMIKVEDIADFGGILIQITDDTYTKIGDAFDYVLEIKNADDIYSSDNTYKFDIVVDEAYEEGEPTGEPNATLLQLANLEAFDWGNYYAHPTDLISIKLTPGEGVDTAAMNLGFNPFSATWNGWSGVWTEEGQFEITTTIAQLTSLNKPIARDGLGGILIQIGGEGLKIGDTFAAELTITTAETGDITLAPEEPIAVDATKNFIDGSKNYSDILVGKYTVPLHFSKDIWNAWCPAVVKLTKDGVDTYYVFAGDQVGWDVTVAYAENEEGKLVSALVVPAKGDLEGYKGETEVANVGEWVVVNAGQSLDYTFDVSDAFTWSIQFMSPAWADESTVSATDADGTAKELPTAGEDGTAYTEVYVYVIGKVDDSSAVEPAPNGDAEPTPTEKPADDKKADTKTDSTSPKTADGTSVAILSLVSILALAGVVVTKKNRA